MNGAVLALGIGGLVFLLFLVWFVGNYNRFVQLRQHVRESWSNVDVELKRRHDLIPNLVETVRRYAQHEREVLEKVAELRAKAASPHASREEQARDESEFLAALRRLFVVVEGYPALRSDRNFLELQEELANTEDRIAAARRLYNGNVRDMNQLCEMFPTNLLARLFGFEREQYFELDSSLERVVPRVRFRTDPSPSSSSTGLP